MFKVITRKRLIINQISPCQQVFYYTICDITCTWQGLAWFPWGLEGLVRCLELQGRSLSDPGKGARIDCLSHSAEIFVWRKIQNIFLSFQKLSALLVVQLLLACEQWFKNENLTKIFLLRNFWDSKTFFSNWFCIFISDVWTKFECFTNCATAACLWAMVWKWWFEK